jgi:hypothetical protein
MTLVDPRTDPRARHLLAHAEDAEPREALRRLNPTLRVWHYPAFDAHRSWTVFEARRSDDPGPLVREVTAIPPGWSGFPLPLEEVRMKVSPPQTIFTRDARVPAEELRARLADGQRILVAPFAPIARIVLDGETSGIEILDSPDRARFQWWCEGTPEWRELVAWATDLRNFFAGSFESGRPLPPSPFLL